MSLYSARGVSAQKEDVERATGRLDKGLFPHAFCKIYPDLLGRDKEWVNLMHADGAGTKSILAYLMWRETGDLSVWKGIAQDAIVMNLDDLLCVGVYNNLLFSSTIDRNKSRIPGDVLEVLINSSQEFFDQLAGFGVNIHYLGGETADVGDLVRTIAVNGTMCARWPTSALITNEKISHGDVIVGISSSGKANYEESYNSGIASNGLTSARHDLLAPVYRDVTESFEPTLDQSVVYIGPHRLTDKHTVFGHGDYMIGQLLLSPTRTYAPFAIAMFKEHFDQINGLVHCSGGGQTKCMKYLPRPFRVVKDNLFEPPDIFSLIQKASGSPDKEMYQVFNMGHRLEIFTNEQSAKHLVALAGSYSLEAQIVGHVENSESRELVLQTKGGEIRYN